MSVIRERERERESLTHSNIKRALLSKTSCGLNQLLLKLKSSTMLISREGMCLHTASQNTTKENYWLNKEKYYTIEPDQNLQKAPISISIAGSQRLFGVDMAE